MTELTGKTKQERLQERLNYLENVRSSEQEKETRLNNPDFVLGELQYRMDCDYARLGFIKVNSRAGYGVGALQTALDQLRNWGFTVKTVKGNDGFPDDIYIS